MNRSLGCESSSSPSPANRSSSVAFTFVRLSRENSLEISTACRIFASTLVPERILSTSPRLVLRSKRIVLDSQNRPADRGLPSFTLFIHSPSSPPTIGNIYVPQGYSNKSLEANAFKTHSYGINPTQFLVSQQELMEIDTCRDVERCTKSISLLLSLSFILDGC